MRMPVSSLSRLEEIILPLVPVGADDNKLFTVAHANNGCSNVAIKFLARFYSAYLIFVDKTNLAVF